MDISTLATILIAIAPALASVVSSICANAKNNSNLKKYELRNYQRLEEKTAKIEKSFNDICSFLENGLKVRVGIDCIGHTRNNMEQENYRRALVKKYDRRLNVELIEGASSYSYKYSLNGVEKNENN